MLCAVILRHLGYRVHEVTTAEEAVAVVNAESAGLLVIGNDSSNNRDLETACREAAVKLVTVGPEERIQTLLGLLERRTSPREAT